MIWSTLEGLDKEVKRPSHVVGVFHNPEALLRLPGALYVQAHEWQVAADRRYLSENSIALPTKTNDMEATRPGLMTA